MWLETASEHFTARHDDHDAPDAERVLAQLEYARESLGRRLDVELGEIAVVLHGSPAQLDAAQPWLPVQRRLTSPAARRYVVGWAAERELHVLSPRLLAQRASNVEGSLEMLMLAPSALLARHALSRRHPGFPPPLGPLRLRRWIRSAWFVEGGAQWLAGQTRHVPPAGRGGAAARDPRGVFRGGRRAVAGGPAPPRAPGGHAAPARGRQARVPAQARRRAAARWDGVRPARARGGRARGGRGRPRRP